MPVNNSWASSSPGPRILAPFTEYGCALRGMIAVAVVIVER